MNLLALATLAALAGGAPPQVLEPGSAAARLRYGFEAGRSATFRITLDKTVTERLTPPPAADGSATPSTEVVVLPTMQFRVAVSVVSHDDAGTQLRFVASQPRFTPGKGVDPGAASALTVAFNGLPEISWTLKLGADGGPVSTQMRSEPYPASSLEVLQLLIESIKWAWVALPAQAVGQGGRFRQEATVEEGGFRMAVTTEVTRNEKDLAVTTRRVSTNEVPIEKPPEGIQGVYDRAETTIQGTLSHTAAGFPGVVKLTADGLVSTRGTAGDQPFRIESRERRVLKMEPL